MQLPDVLLVEIDGPHGRASGVSGNEVCLLTIEIHYHCNGIVPMCVCVRVTSGGYGSITQLAEGDPKIYLVLYSVYKHNYTPGKGISKENKSEEPLCQSGHF